MLRTPRKIVDPKFGLRDIEVQIIRAMAEGRDTDQVGAFLGLSKFTVRDYLKQVYAKMDVHGQIRMVLKAERAGLLEGIDA